jgi:hypothetical protein
MKIRIKMQSFTFDVERYKEQLCSELIVSPTGWDQKGLHFLVKNTYYKKTLVKSPVKYGPCSSFEAQTRAA